MTEKTIRNLKTALVEELIDQIKEGPAVLNKDGELERVSPPASLLSVAAKVVKDFADEAAEDTTDQRNAESLAAYLSKRRVGMSNVAN